MFDFIGEARFPTGYQFAGVEMGGLSGISYDAAQDIYFAISDDRGGKAPARFYVLKIALADGSLRTGDVSILDMKTLINRRGNPYVNDSIDSEGIAFFDRDLLFISSEGGSKPKFKPFIRGFSTGGAFRTSLKVPGKFIPTRHRDRGFRNNLGFEALGITPDRKLLFSANEGALAQDGAVAGPQQGSSVRIIKFNLQTRKAVAEYLYRVEPVDVVPQDGTRAGTNGLVELIALDDTSLICMERRFARSAGTRIRLFHVSLSGADDISRISRLDKVDDSRIKSARKTLLLDSADFGVETDNIEGMTFGPDLPDGKRTLIFVSDNNFSPRQVTQFLGFVVTETRETTIAEIQGQGHRSPFVGMRVTGVQGIVTHLKGGRSAKGFWLQDAVGDGDKATSDAIFVLTGTDRPEVKVGDRVRVSGEISESAQSRQLSVTTIERPAYSVISSGHSLPTPVTLGLAGRSLPTAVFDDDALQTFQPETDALDLYESLEGMRVKVDAAVVVGSPNRFSEFYVLADSGKNADLRSARGGIVLREGDPNPERIQISCSSQKPLPPMETGDIFDGSIQGILDYSFSNYKILCTEPLPALHKRDLAREKTSLAGTGEQLTVATYNVENLDLEDKPERFNALAATIVDNLQSPDILALQEVQDDNGPRNDNVTDATGTLTRLSQTIQDAGGPDYDFRQVNPMRNREGGQPGGNIRVAFMFNPERVTFNDRGQPGPGEENAVLHKNGGVHLSLNPGRIGTKAAAFIANKARHFSNSRRPLAGEFIFNGHQVFIINNHLSSKGGDDRFMGGNQPPMFRSEVQRREQAKFVHNFAATILSADADANVIVLGDMNEHEFRSPIRVLAGKELTNLMLTVPVADRYTFIFSGNSQLLDHILVSRRLNSVAAPEVDIVHVNAEFSSDKQASDHDPVVASFRLPKSNI